MAEKEKTGLIKLQIAAGQANPAPPVGPALGQHGVNIMDFCNAFNDATKELQGMLTPVIITCLLYTSPSPRDQVVSRMPSSA